MYVFLPFFFFFHPSLDVFSFHLMFFSPPFLFSLLGFSFILGCFDLVCMFFPLLLFWLLSFHPSLDDFTLSVCFLSLFFPPSSHLIVFILGCFHIKHVYVFPLFLFLLIGIHPSIHPLDVSPCVYAFISPFSLFASWYSSIHLSLGCFHLVCVLFYFPFFFFRFLIFIHSFIPWMFSPCVRMFAFFLLFSISLLVCFHS